MAAANGLVLVIDDEPEVRSVLGEFLQLEGYAVAFAATGGEGLGRLRHEVADIVMLDLDLPDMSGMDVMRAMLAAESRPDVVIITGNATLSSAIDAVELGAAAYVTKPLDFARIGSLVARLSERRRLVHENARLQAEQSERTAELEALVDFAGILNSTLEPTPLLTAIARKTAALVGADRCSIYLFRDGYVLPVMSQFADGHRDPEQWERFKAMGRLRITDVPVYEAALARRAPVVIEDAAQHELAPPYWPAFGIKSALVVPLIRREVVVGAMNLDRTSAAGGYGEARVRLATTIASQIALSVENARLFESVTREQLRLEAFNGVIRRLAAMHDTDEILRFIVSEATTLLGADAAAIRLVEEDELVLAAWTAHAAPLTTRRRIRIGESLSGRAVASGQPVAVEDVTTEDRYDLEHRRDASALGFHSFLTVPLRAAETIIGALSIYTKARERFSQEKIALLTTFADQASLAIEKGKRSVSVTVRRSRAPSALSSRRSHPAAIENGKIAKLK
jgi:GAF domain-containing protein/CheY-like chemotaxis protein